MKVIVFDKNTQPGGFNTYGYGKLKYIEKCEITEELNGRYDLELILLKKDPKKKYIKKWTIIWVDGQLYRVRSLTDNDKDNFIKIYCKHIFYDIGYGFIEDQRAEKTTIAAALKVAVPTDFKHFTTSSDIKDINTLYFVKNNGSQSVFAIIERWGKGELVRDNFNIAINEAKGKDKGVTFTYKKIEAIEIHEDSEDVVTRLYPSGKDGITLEEKYITIPNWNDEEYPPFHITKEVKFEGAESTGELRILARKEAEKIGLSKVNFKINVHDLINTSIYKEAPQLMTVEVGDIVTIKHDKLDVRVKVKCIKKVHDKATKKIVLEFGQPLENFFSNIDNGNVDLTIPDLSKYEDHMFYYFNDKAFTVKTEELYSLCYLTYAVNSQTNLMLYYNLFFNAKTDCTIKLHFKIDNVLLTFSPTLDISAGNRHISFTYPLIATEGGKAHTLNAAIELVGGGEIFVPKESVHIIVKGQNVSGSMKEGPHAEVEETFNFTYITLGDIDNSSNVKISLKGPKVVKCSDSKDIKIINIDKINTVEELYPDVYNKGFITTFNDRDFIYNEEALTIDKEAIKFKELSREVEFNNYPSTVENGYIYYVELMERDSYDSIAISEVIEND